MLALFVKVKRFKISLRLKPGQDETETTVTALQLSLLTRTIADEANRSPPAGGIEKVSD